MILNYEFCEHDLNSAKCSFGIRARGITRTRKTMSPLSPGNDTAGQRYGNLLCFDIFCYKHFFMCALLMCSMMNKSATYNCFDKYE